ncbi:ABC transporter substrate-binding protein [Mycolicibacterium wolinskyi]|uniref:ABC transporter substrate-binding protein n=1 Tax=Mycolicibacterium wolinskyi TaxID=59750 RepID=A0A1X2EYQ7_9MYCO|nr:MULTISPECIES: ABC transporter substrate-binding protein [Mycolicibacterium]MCV7285164.1 ABC transporter substrate-binding protein [Mycolicibacterium wolinskyi]MCV7292288.1 ABC transporter substrate-binding protein [Mycolicibacterium goodii]ORX11198.1 ABC transporter substrate-binding protein [Mycolicibacterium wolinskyi]
MLLRCGAPRLFRLTTTACAAAVLVLAGCATASGPGEPDQIVLADGQELGNYNPVSGYGELGVSPLYEGLYRPRSTTDAAVPDLVPALAIARPEPVGPRRWRVALRDGVRFSDGSAFDSADVVATYAAVKDPAVASEISTHIAPIVNLTADGSNAVVVEATTAADVTPFLLLGILPSEKIESKPAAEWSVNTQPVGTGPYRLDSLRPDQAVMVARDDYWGTPAQVRRIVYTYTPDDNVRAQRIVAGEVDGVNLPPKLIDSIDSDTVRTVAAQSADWRGVALPAGNPFTADPRARVAMNFGVDRDAAVRDVLAGHGRPASTPIAAVYGSAFNPDAQFDFDLTKAGTILDRAGWRPGPQGVREKDGAKASFELLYNAQDSLRRDLSVAFAAAMKPLGVEVRPRGTSWDEIDTRFGDSAVLLGGGSTPYSIDSQVYDTLHTRVPDSSPYSNPGDFTARNLDGLLERARDSAPGAEKDKLYRDIQAAYVAEPSYVFLAFLHHTYGYRDLSWKQAQPILEPHSHGVSWGPWWDVAAWTR